MHLFEDFREGYGIPKKFWRFPWRIRNTKKVLKISVKDTKYQKSLWIFLWRIRNTKKVLKISVKDTKYQKGLQYFHEGYGIPKKSWRFPWRIQNTKKVLIFPWRIRNTKKVLLVLTLGLSQRPSWGQDAQKDANPKAKMLNKILTLDQNAQAKFHGFPSPKRRRNLHYCIANTSAFKHSNMG